MLKQENNKKYINSIIDMGEKNSTKNNIKLTRGNSAYLRRLKTKT